LEPNSKIVLNQIYKPTTGGEAEKFFNLNSYSLLSKGVKIDCKVPDSSLMTDKKIYFTLEHSYSYPSVVLKKYINFARFPNNTIVPGPATSGDYWVMTAVIVFFLLLGAYCYRHIKKS
jgi:hypothetical protein